MTHKDTHGAACTCHSCAPDVGYPPVGAVVRYGARGEAIVQPQIRPGAISVRRIIGGRVSRTVLTYEMTAAPVVLRRSV